MPKLPALLVALIVAATAGCGGGSSGADGATAGKSDADCAAGRGDVQIADILPEAPPGLAIVESDPEDIAPVVEPLRQKLEPVLRSIETRAVVPEDSLMGTGVVLVNYSKQNGDPEDVVTASLTAAHETPGMRDEELSVAGTRAALLEPEDAAMQITWPVGDCALGILYDDDRERILSVAEALRAPPAP